MNQEFKIKVIKQNRILISIPIFISVTLLTILISTGIESIFFKILFGLFIAGSEIILLYYFSFGILKITFRNDKLNFKWKKKPIFNFKEYGIIELEKIKILIIEENYLSKIITENSKIEIGGIKSRSKDNSNLLSLLKNETHLEPIDIWNFWKIKGWLKTVYYVNIIVSTSIISILIIFIFFKEINSKILLFIPLILSQLIFSHFQIKKRLEKN